MPSLGIFSSPFSPPRDPARCHPCQLLPGPAPGAAPQDGHVLSCESLGRLDMLCGHRGEGLVARVRKNERSQGDLKPTALGNPCLPAVPLDHTALEESGPGGGGWRERWHQRRDVALPGQAV